MKKIVLDKETVQMLCLFEQCTQTHAKDCITLDEQLIFIVPTGEIGRAIGKGGQHIKRLEQKLRKRIKIIEYHQELSEFVKSVIAPLEIADLRLETDTLYLTAKDLKTRGMLIGRGASHLRLFESIIQRYFPIKQIKVT